MFLKNKMNLSILIPSFNWNVYRLISDLTIQCQKEYKPDCYEIICIEDGSTCLFENNKITELNNVQYQVLKNNIGRASIRNLLAKKAKFEWLLFIDCDSKIIQQNFIQNYKIQSQSTQKDHIYYGQTIYQKNNQPDTILHERYGLIVESKSKKTHFSSHHFLIKKELFEQAGFDEQLQLYGYEDVLFEVKSNFQFKFIDNPLYHIGLKKTDDFLKDCELGLKNLLNYTDQKDVVRKIKILKWWKRLSRIHYIILKIFIYFQSSILKNLKSKNPRIVLFQFYKLGLLIKLKRDSIKN
ncbi:MAG: hypothetical protein CMD27_02575 [Flavobacteriales bacterium]|nr:hypothetical protein [Flavobacteriales bacterium]